MVGKGKGKEAKYSKLSQNDSKYALSLRSSLERGKSNRREVRGRRGERKGKRKKNIPHFSPIPLSPSLSGRHKTQATINTTR